MPRNSATKTLSVFNNGLPLEAVLLPSQSEEGEPHVGILSRDAGYGKVWIEYDMTWSQVACRDVQCIKLPKIPEHYGKWIKTSIGGVSSTIRRIDVIRALHSEHRPLVVFAVNAISPTIVQDTFRTMECDVTVGDTEHDDIYGYVTEIVVHHSEDVSFVAAMIARVGAVPMLEDSSFNARRCLGIERLDRISAKVVTDDTMVDCDDDTLFGLRRGCENWKFSWMPPFWKEVPITWDHMVRNVISQPLMDLPQPLRQHVARTRLDQGDFPPVGSQWEPCTTAPSEHVLEWNRSLSAEVPLEHMYKRVVQLDEEDEIKVLLGDRDVASRVPLNCITLIDGVWYQPVNTRGFLEKCIPGRDKRWVTPHLTHVQSKQLIEAFYLLTVERIATSLERKVCKLILFRYMVERGYTARWIGKYDQDGNHVGNGDTFRKFRHLSQYAPDRLPSDILSKLCGRDGRLNNKGSKGTRSKYKQKTETKRYVPKRRLKRTKNDERQMM
jgi:hypothetical protein